VNRMTLFLVGSDAITCVVCPGVPDKFVAIKDIPDNPFIYGVWKNGEFNGLKSYVTAVDGRCMRIKVHQYRCILSVLRPIHDRSLNITHTGCIGLKGSDWIGADYLRDHVFSNSPVCKRWLEEAQFVQLRAQPMISRMFLPLLCASWVDAAPLLMALYPDTTEMARTFPMFCSSNQRFRPTRMNNRTVSKMLVEYNEAVKTLKQSVQTDVSATQVNGTEPLWTTKAVVAAIETLLHRTLIFCGPDDTPPLGRDITTSTVYLYDFSDCSTCVVRDAQSFFVQDWIRISQLCKNIVYIQQTDAKQSTGAWICDVLKDLSGCK